MKNLKKITLILTVLISQSTFAQENLDSLLFVAVKENNIEQVKEFVKNGADVNAKFKYSTPLHVACYNNREGEMFQIVKHLIVKGANVNAKLEDGNTPLLYACRYKKSFDVVKLLIDMGADVNARDKIGDSPLISACAGYNRFNIANLLIESGADVNAYIKNDIKDYSHVGFTPLLMATY